MNSIYLAATVAMVAGLSAYAPVTESGQEQIPLLPMSLPVGATSMTLTGCVAQGTSADTYLLTGIVRDVEPMAPPVAMAKEGSKSETLLLTSSDVDVSKHVGHKVTVTGMAVAADRPVGTSGAIDAKPGTDSAMTRTGAKIPAGFTVKSLKMISASCADGA